MKKYLITMAVFFLIFASCADREKLSQLEKENPELKNQISRLNSDLQDYKNSYEKFQFLARKLAGIKARIVTDYGNIEVNFYPEEAPLHCFSFITRAESGFYNNTQFHRVIPDFMIQAGDPNSRDNNPLDDGQGGPIAMIPHEFNRISHKPGILSMARTSDIGMGAGSQFFIMHGTKAHLDGQYTAFGEVTNGMEVVDKIAGAQTFGRENRQAANHPVKPIRIKTIEVYR